MEDEASTRGDGKSGNSLRTAEPGKQLRVGCALLPKKVSRYLTPSMKSLALSQGVELVLIDYQRPLFEQGPFDAIIHKLRPNKEWERNLLEYCQVHPEVTVIDRVDGIRTLQNRSTMLSSLQGAGVLIAQDNADGQLVRIQAPHQIEIPEGTTVAEARRMLDAAGLQPPLLVKPLWTDGREGSHGLAVLHELQNLDRLLSGQVSSELQPPLVVQQFVEHGGVLFKVYVLGERTVVSMRPSLGERHLGHAAREGVLPLPRISCKSATDLVGLSGSEGGGGLADGPDLSYASPVGRAASQQLSETSSNGGSRQSPAGECSSSRFSSFTPPDWVTHALSGVLRERLGLQLFNFDLICPSNTQQAQQAQLVAEEDEGAHGPGGCEPRSEWLYYVVDVNYFPGVDKIPDFEHMFIAFLKDACAGFEGVPHPPTTKAPAAAVVDAQTGWGPAGMQVTVAANGHGV